MHKAANRPWPVLCPEDPVIDYMVMEAVALKAQREDARARKDAEMADAKRKEAKRLKELVN